MQSGAEWVSPGHQRETAGRAHLLAGVEIVELDALARHFVEIRRLHDLVAAVAGIAPAMSSAITSTMFGFFTWATTTAIANVSVIRQFHNLLRNIGVGLAFDDFGTGQTRLAELAETPPNFIKIDMRLTRGIDRPPARQDIVRALIQVACRLGAFTGGGADQQNPDRRRRSCGRIDAMTSRVSLPPERFALASVIFGETREDLRSQTKTGLKLFERTPDKTIA
jgi:hypothetical protein